MVTGETTTGSSIPVFIVSMAEAFASANPAAEDLSDELFVKEKSIAADAVAKQIAITRQVLRIIFHFFTTLSISSRNSGHFYVVETHARYSFFFYQIPAIHIEIDYRTTPAVHSPYPYFLTVNHHCLASSFYSRA